MCFASKYISHNNPHSLLVIQTFLTNTVCGWWLRLISQYIDNRLAIQLKESIKLQFYVKLIKSVAYFILFCCLKNKYKPWNEKVVLFFRKKNLIQLRKSVSVERLQKWSGEVNLLQQHTIKITLSAPLFVIINGPFSNIFPALIYTLEQWYLTFSWPLTIELVKNTVITHSPS